MKKTNNNKYYDGTKLLSMKDLNGNKPEIIICTTNRTGGKSTWFGKYVVNKFLKSGEKFALLYRYNYELTDVADKFFKDIGSLFFKNKTMTGKTKARGVYVELSLQDSDDDTGETAEVCGYAIALNAADSIKKLSHLFSDVKRMIFDEFQSETNKYCPNEIQKFISIHTSIARGQGEQVRYVPVYMISNPVSIINPYYVEMGISTRLREDTKFLKGDGFVLEQGYVDSASKAQVESGFNRAFSSNSYVSYSAQCVYLNDSSAFIERPPGTSTYLATLKYNGTMFALREFPELGIIYCDDKADSSFRFKLCVTTEDHNVNYVMIKRNDMFLNTLRFYFERGAFRFKDLRCKDAVLKALSY